MSLSEYRNLTMVIGAEIFFERLCGLGVLGSIWVLEGLLGANFGVFLLCGLGVLGCGARVARVLPQPTAGFL